MNIDSSVVFGIISIVGSLLIASAGYGAMKQKVVNMEKSQAEFREAHEKKHDKEEESTACKFKELYESRNTTALAVERLGVLIEQIFRQLDAINEKLDKALDK